MIAGFILSVTSAVPVVIGVSINPGQTQLIRMSSFE